MTQGDIVKRERRAGVDIRKLIVVDSRDYVEEVRKALGASGYHVYTQKSVLGALDDAVRLGAIVLVGETVWRATERQERELFFTTSPEIYRLLVVNEGPLRRDLAVSRFHGHIKKHLGVSDVRHALWQIKSTEKVFTENRELRDFVDRATKELSFFIDVGKSLTSTSEPGQILDIILGKIQKMIRAEGWTIFLHDEQHDELAVVLVKRWGRRSSWKRKVVPPGKGIVGRTFLSGEPASVADVKSDRSYYAAVDAPDGVKVRSLMAVPIKSGGDTIGVLQVVNRRDGLPFDEKDLKLVLELVDQAAIAIERGKIYQRMAEMVITDDLTKLFNLRYLNRTIDVEMERSRRYGTPLSVIFMDMDFFKEVNDAHGHLMGSKVLAEVARLLIGKLRSVDIVSRYGGDEFVVVLPQTNISAALMIAERLRKAVANNVFLAEEGISLKLSASFGVASFPEHAETREQILALADKAMYRAKNKTRNCVFTIESSTPAC
ncbi:MAG: sensor domain-containing diguanylate cyclase [Nitrospirota bacterium]|nr:sensor domain-containing diguanylate cyclase [Nitrospirota bacterium]